MKQYFKKHETLITIFLIIVYIVLNSYCMQNFGMTDYRTMLLNFILLAIIFILIVNNKLIEYYGLGKMPVAKDFLYYIPLIIIASVNLWSGININNSFMEILWYMLSMICVGFLEEIIFRGFLFKMMEKDNVKSAIIVSSVTFGIGHIVNLFNGAALFPTLIQICYAIAIGYLFVIIFQKGKSLWPCIITHCTVNALSIFNIDNIISLYIVPVVLIVIPIWYARYLIKS